MKKDGVEVMGFPLDNEEDGELLEEYAGENELGFELMSQLGAGERSEAVNFLKEVLRVEELPLPTSWITNAEGRIIWAGAGLPTVSDVRKLLEGE